jgi:hypothetical protein
MRKIVSYRDVEELLKYIGKTIENIENLGDCFKIKFTDGTFIDIKEGTVGYENLCYLVLEDGELKAA